MSEYLIPSIHAAAEESLGRGTYILIMHAHQVPPHLSLVIDGKVYALGIKGPRLAMPLELQLKLIKAKKVETIFVKLKQAMLVEGENIYQQAEKYTLAYTKVEP